MGSDTYMDPRKARRSASVEPRQKEPLADRPAGRLLVGTFVGGAWAGFGAIVASIFMSDLAVTWCVASLGVFGALVGLFLARPLGKPDADLEDPSSDLARPVSDFAENIKQGCAEHSSEASPRASHRS